MKKALAAIYFVAASIALASDLGGDGLGGAVLQPRANSTGLGEPGLANRELAQVDPVMIAAGEPSLDFRFADNKWMRDSVTNEQSLITFSRSAASSPGTYVGADGLIKEAAVNEVLYSEQFDNAAWTKTNATVLANQIVAPDGKQTAEKLVATSAYTGFNTHRVFASASISSTSTASIYVKQAGLPYAFIRNYSATPTPLISIAVFNLSSASLDYSQNVSSTSIDDVGDGWYRISATFARSGFQNFGVASSGYTIVGDEVVSTGNDVDGIYLWGAQLEEGTVATPYIRTTSQALAAPRFDHDPVTGESLGLLVEEARSNLFLNSATLATQTVTTTAAAHTLSFYGTGTVDLTGTHTATVVGTGAYPARTTLTFTPTAGSLTATVTGTVQFAQLEAGAFPTSYIPTESISLSRAADVAAVQDADFATTNLLAYSESFNVGWTTARLEPVTANATTAPDGSLTADYIEQESGQTTAGGVFVSRAYTGQEIISVYAKAAEKSFLRIYDATSNSAYFNLSNGTVGTVSGGSATIQDAGNGWYRCTLSTTITLTANMIFYVADADNSSTVTDSGGIYLWGASLTATEYPVAYTTTRNLLTDSQDFERATWASNNASISSATTSDPNGNATATLFTPTNVSTYTRVRSSAKTIATATHSIYVKSNGYSKVALREDETSGVYAAFDLSSASVIGYTATSASISGVGNGWYRISMTASAASQRLAIWILDPSYTSGAITGGWTADGTSGIYLWGAQLEPGSTATDYVRTVDVVGKAYRWYEPTEGTVYAQYRSPTVATRGIVSLDDNTANEAIALQSFYSTGTQLVVTDGGTQQANTAASIITDGAAYTGIAGYKASDFAIATAGDVAIDVAGTIPTANRMRIGVNQGGNYLNGHIARLAYWPVRKANDILDLISDPVANDSYQILVKTDNAGTSTSTQFTIPANAGTYNVDWGDGTTSTGLTGAQTHTYPAAGQYVIRMDGITHYYTNDGGDKLKLLDVQNWGDEAWTSMQLAYRGAANMIMSATDAPDFSGVTDMSQMLRQCTSFNQPIGHWDVSSVTNMQTMFLGATAFNQPIGDWDVSGATLMNVMFFQATSFNQPIGNWDVSNVTNIGNMFNAATSFNQPIGSWNVGNVTDYTNFMFGKTNLNYSAANLDAIYNGWIVNELSPAETITFGTIKYTAAGAEGRAILTRSNATVAVSNAVDNGSGLVRLTTAAHGLSTGNKVYIKGIVGTTEANGLHTVTVVDATTIDLQGTTFTNTYTSGGTVRTGYGWTITDGGI